MTVMTRQALFEAAWQRPLTEIASELGITSTGLRKVCDRYDIPTPGRGYWAQVYAGKTFPRPALRTLKNSASVEVRIAGARAMSPAVVAAIKKSKALVTPRTKAKVRPAAPGAPAPQAQPAELPQFEAQDSKGAGDPPVLRKDLVATARAIRRAKLGSNGFGSASGDGVVSITVSPTAQDAALEFLTRLLQVAETRGWQLQSGAEGGKLLIDGEAINFRVEEQPHKTLHEPTAKELAAKRDRDRWGGDSHPWPTWDLSPSSRLALIIEENDYSGLRRTYSQRRGHAFQESVDSILTGFAAHAALKAERRREAREAARVAAIEKARREKVEAFAHREKRRMEFATAINATLRERDELRSVLGHVEGMPDEDGPGPPGMADWLRRRLRALEARVGADGLRISARHAEIEFLEPPTGKDGSHWYSPAVKLHLWAPAEEEGRVSGVSELEWAICEGLISDPGAMPATVEPGV